MCEGIKNISISTDGGSLKCLFCLSFLRTNCQHKKHTCEPHHEAWLVGFTSCVKRMQCAQASLFNDTRINAGQLGSYTGPCQGFDECSLDRIQRLKFKYHVGVHYYLRYSNRKPK